MPARIYPHDEAEVQAQLSEALRAVGDWREELGPLNLAICGLRALVQRPGHPERTRTHEEMLESLLIERAEILSNLALGEEAVDSLRRALARLADEHLAGSLEDQREAA